MQSEHPPPQPRLQPPILLHPRAPGPSVTALEHGVARDRRGPLKDASKAVVEQLPADPLKEHLAKLRAEQTRIKQERKDVAKAVKVAQRKQQRLRQRTRLMSSEDLVAALLMRKEAADKRAAGQSRDGEAAVGQASQSSGSGSKSPDATGPAVDAAGAEAAAVDVDGREGRESVTSEARGPEASGDDREREASMEE